MVGFKLGLGCDKGLHRRLLGLSGILRRLVTLRVNLLKEGRVLQNVGEDHEAHVGATQEAAVRGEESGWGGGGRAGSNLRQSGGRTP